MKNDIDILIGKGESLKFSIQTSMLIFHHGVKDSMLIIMMTVINFDIFIHLSPQIYWLPLANELHNLFLRIQPLPRGQIQFLPHSEKGWARPHFSNE